MLNVRLTINAPCEYAAAGKGEKILYCMYNKKYYKGYSTCNERCSIGRKKIEAVEKVIQMVIERKKNG